MKKTLLALSVAMLLILSFAANANAATVYAFTFHDTAGNPYCDGLVIQLYGAPKAVVGGYHFNYDCTNTSSVAGFKHGLAAAYQYAASGAVLDVTDPAFGLEGSNRSEQWLVNTKFHTWILWSGSDFATNSVVNFGTFVPGQQAEKKGTRPASQR